MRNNLYKKLAPNAWSVGGGRGIVRAGFTGLNTTETFRVSVV